MWCARRYIMIVFAWRESVSASALFDHSQATSTYVRPRDQPHQQPSANVCSRCLVAESHAEASCAAAMVTMISFFDLQAVRACP